MNHMDIRHFIESKKITCSNIIELLNKSDIKLFNMDDKYLIRLSKYPQNELSILKIIQNIDYVPHIIDFGLYKNLNEDWHYSILTFQKGIDLYDAIKTLNKDQIEKIASELCIFLDQLHSVKNENYDIGLYIPTIKNTKLSWKEGHKQYILWLKENIELVFLNTEAKMCILNAFKYLEHNIDALNDQRGPVLLHNDLHLKNIIIDQNHLSGIIDFECAQYGERDFDLTHLVHWTLFPKEDHNLLKDLLKSIIKQFQLKHHLDQLDIRLTIYQIEHEIAQLIWSKGNEEVERVNRINQWENGIITDLFKVWDI